MGENLQDEEQEFKTLHRHEQSVPNIPTMIFADVGGKTQASGHTSERSNTNSKHSAPVQTR